MSVIRSAGGAGCSWSGIRALIKASIGLVVGGIALSDQHDAFGILILVGMALFLFGAIYGLVAARMVSPTKIDDHYVWLKGAHPEYLASFPVWPG